ncbi:MAG: hypothetical protein KF713_20445 [Turneriella sp.]|nr:hypothetical protein [Turneriella sp.]
MAEFVERVQARFTPEKVRSEGAYEEIDLDGVPKIHGESVTKRVAAKK